MIADELEFNTQAADTDVDEALYAEIEIEDAVDKSQTTREDEYYRGLGFTAPLTLATATIHLTRWSIDSTMTPEQVSAAVAKNEQADKVEAMWPMVGPLVETMYAPLARKVHIKKKMGIYRKLLDTLNNWYDTAKHNNGVGVISCTELEQLINVGHELGVLK